MQTLLSDLRFAFRSLRKSPGFTGVVARSLWPDDDAIGKRLEMFEAMRTVVGTRSMTLVSAGIAVGIASALGITRVPGGFLYGVQSTDPVSFVSIPLFLSIVAVVASLAPAMRAARLSPTVSLRTE